MNESNKNCEYIYNDSLQSENIIEFILFNQALFIFELEQMHKSNRQKMFDIISNTKDQEPYIKPELFNEMKTYIIESIESYLEQFEETA